MPGTGRPAWTYTKAALNAAGTDNWRGGLTWVGENGPELALHLVERDERNGMSPASVAALVAKTAERKNPAPLYTAGFQYKVFTLLIRLLPRRFASYLVGKIYGG